jgi:hypothetical protein
LMPRQARWQFVLQSVLLKKQLPLVRRWCDKIN